MDRKHLRRMIVAIILGGLIVPLARQVDAAHESTNYLSFAAPSGAGTALGNGEVTYHGGDADSSRWTTQFRFTGLDPNHRYVVVVKGRYGADGSPDAEAFTSLCSFQSNSSGSGGCWWYHKVLRRLGIVQLRTGDETGTVVLQATRDPSGPGSITSIPNAFSPPSTLTGTPTDATPVSTSTESASSRD